MSGSQQDLLKFFVRVVSYSPGRINRMTEDKSFEAHTCGFRGCSLRACVMV